MPYAADGKISQDQFEGSIEITEEQYTEGLEGLCSGMSVTIDSGFKVSIPAIPEPEPEPKLTPEVLAANAISKRDQLLAVAAIRIEPLQDAVDLDDDTPSDIANLKKWKQYRVAVNRIQDQSEFPTVITWPVPPSE